MERNPQSGEPLTLALALMANSRFPALLIDEAMVIIAASASFGHEFGVPVRELAGRALLIVDGGRWATGEMLTLVRSAREKTSSSAICEIDLHSAGHTKRLSITAQAIQSSSPANQLVLITFVNVTETRLAEKLKQDLLTQKDFLIKDLRHRIASSLQILASVIMLSARNLQTDEARRAIYDTHHRLISVASLQTQLLESADNEVELSNYFHELCQSIESSLVYSMNNVSLKVRSAHRVVKADIAISFGLMATELIVNAIKHAFTTRDKGEITLEYLDEGRGWTLAVMDNGLGITSGDGGAKRGLGSNIVAALAKQLNATVDITTNALGTRISIIQNYDA